MAGTSRTRTRPAKYLTGSCTKLGGTYSRSIVAELSETCTDVVGNIHADNPLSIDRGRSNWASFSGNNGQTGIAYRDYTTYPATFAFPGFTAPYFNTAALATKLLARTNPGRSEIMLPVFLAELKELPKLVLIAGRTIFKTIANANLAWQFGWTPLLGDLRRMMNFQESVAKRTDEINRLMSKSGLKRRMLLQTWDKTTKSSSDAAIESFNSFVYARYSTIENKECWGTVRWIPAPHSAIPATDAERLKMTRKLILGLGPGQLLPNIWEGLPWSWLIDWFSNIGDFIEASNNSIAVPTGSANIMFHTTADKTYQITTKPAWVQMDPASLTASREKKSRYIVSATPSIRFSLPFLTGRQLSILGSLWVQRKR